MTRLLDQIISVLPESQKDAVRSLLERKKKVGQITSLRSAEEEANRLNKEVQSKLGSKLLDPKYAISGEKISSDDHNSNMEKIYLDLNSLYENINTLGQSEQFYNVALNSEYLKSEAAIRKLINDANTFALRKKYPDFNEVKLIDFSASSNTSKAVPPANINTKTKSLELQPIKTERYQLLNRTARSTKIYTKTYSTGIKGSLEKAFPVQNIADQRPESFWAEVVLSEVPMKQTYELPSLGDSFSQIEVNGPISEVYFKFSHVEKINTVNILPFAEFPVKIIDVAYRSSNSSSFFKTVDGFTQQSSLDWIQLNFVPVFASEVRVTIAQENYKNVIYHLPKRLVINTDLFQKIIELKQQQPFNNVIFDSDQSIDLLNSLSAYDSALSLLEDVIQQNGGDYNTELATDYLDKLLGYLAEVYNSIDPDIASSLLSRSRTEEQDSLEDEIIEVNKYEYVYGLREVEINYNLYAPVSTYESQKYDTQATVSQISLEVDQSTITRQTQWESGYSPSSVEWEIEIGRGKRFPIHPRNLVDKVDNIPAVKDERIFFDLGTQTAYTRLGGYYSTPYALKKEGELVPLDTYTAIRETGSIPRIKVTLTGEWFDPNGIYTIDYAVSPTNYSVDILENFKSSPIPSPEKFTEMGPDNDINLEKYPFINYGVINLEAFEKTTGDAIWVFTPDLPNFNSGQIRITPTVVDQLGNVLQSGGITGYSTPGIWGNNTGTPTYNFGNLSGFSNNYFGEFSGANYGYFLQGMDSPNYAELSNFDTGITGFILQSPLQVTDTQISQWLAQSSGLAFTGTFSGADVSGDLIIDYTLGIGVKTDDQIFTLGNVTYEPIIVKIGSIKARNITNYETLVHPAFNLTTRKDNEYEYIHAGKNIYFNQPITEKEISVEYRWISEYLKINSTLRCNKSINPDITPKISSITVLSNNIII